MKQRIWDFVSLALGVHHLVKINPSSNKGNRISLSVIGGRGDISDTLKQSDITMQQGKLQTSKSSSRLVSVPKRLWRARAKSQSRISTGHAGLWIPEGNNRWKSSGGQRVNLQPVNLLQLSEIERVAFQQVALAKLKSSGLQCDIPKEVSSVEKTKRRPALLRRKAATTSLFEGKGQKDKESADSSCTVFGIPLSKCVQNDRASTQRSASFRIYQDQSRLNTEALMTAAGRRSESLNDAMDATGLRSGKESGSSESLPSLRPHSDGGLLETINSGGDRPLFKSLLYGDGPQVPRVVKSCLRHLENYGLNTLGLFRVSSSKKRIRQLREDFDSGQNIQLDSEFHPHDVAQLLKEYFRDLPDPLLTRDLYTHLLNTLRFRPAQQLEAQRFLVSLLPVYNRDTLWALSNFLGKVVENSVDRKNADGEMIIGNRMDAQNLATLFGPNILRIPQSGKGSEFLVENNARMEERCDVILVVRNLIENHKKMFEVTVEDLDAVYRRLQIEDPEALDAVMKWRFHSQLENDTENVVDNRLVESGKNTRIPSISFNDVRPLMLAEDSPSRSAPDKMNAGSRSSTDKKSHFWSRSSEKNTVKTDTNFSVSEPVTIKPPQRRERTRYSLKPSERKNMIEKSASTSSILHPRMEDRDDSPERPLASQTAPIAAAKNLASILITSDHSIRRKSKGSNSVSAVRFQNERWKRWEIIASEYTEH